MPATASPTKDVPACEPSHTTDHHLISSMQRSLYDIIRSLGKRFEGIFHFNFWQFGSWVEVVIDDRLPCREQRKEGGGKEITLVYGRNDLEPNEYWVPLFEKAYAKYDDKLLSKLIVIVISKFLHRHSKAKRSRAPAYSRSLNLAELKEVLL